MIEWHLNGTCADPLRPLLLTVPPKKFGAFCRVFRLAALRCSRSRIVWPELIIHSIRSVH